MNETSFSSNRSRVTSVRSFQNLLVPPYFNYRVRKELIVFIRDIFSRFFCLAATKAIVVDLNMLQLPFMSLSKLIHIIVTHLVI